MKGTKADPITVENAQIDRRFKWCRCSACDRVAMCTPEMDFWYPCTYGSGEGKARLLCDPCHDEYLVKQCGFDRVIDKRPDDLDRLRRITGEHN